jgi:hypothetical protein
VAAKAPKAANPCNPPWEIDAHGVRRYKLACL